METGWTSGLSFAPLPQDPFLLATTDGGKTWRSHAIFNETRFGSIQQFFFEDKTSGSLVIDHGAGSGEDRYELFETNDGGDTWNIRETNVKSIRHQTRPARLRTPIGACAPTALPRATNWNIARDRDGFRSPRSP